MSEMISPHSYKVPQKHVQRLQYVRDALWIGLVFWLISAAFTAHAFFHASNDVLKMYGHLGVVTILCVGAGIYYYRNAHYSYWCGPVQVIFVDDVYYVPPEVMTPVINEVLEAWRPHLPEPVEDVYQGVKLYIQRNRPRHPGVHISPERIIGLTSNAQRASYIWGPYALHGGGTGYELRLHGAEYLWPYATEDIQIHRMKELEVI